ncbi:pirin-like C-terminal cupin domain-containing protein [Streptomyces sp. NPDC059909]|uniref:pirin-like C-terminal cupin domain-containing protein n=1 Tax=Streptomyces sp. NPDC059909 TaxID=3346998 RepID=UPI003658108A
MTHDGPHSWTGTARLVLDQACRADACSASACGHPRGGASPLTRSRANTVASPRESSVAGRPVRAGEIAWSDPLPQASLSTIALETADGDEHSVVMVYSGEPIGQPVTMGGPFVMNSASEIEQAFRDFHSGGFGDIPNQARLQFR